MDARLRALWGERLYSRLPLVGGWLRKAAVRKLAADDSPESVGLLAAAVARTDDPEVRLLALEALEAIDGGERPRCVDAVCAAWARTRHPLLEAVLTVHGWGEKAPLAVRVLYYLATGREEALAGEGADAVGPLLGGCRDADAAIAARARRVLGRLHDAGAREALCQAALDDPGARELAAAAGYAPREPARRALFYFLTEQWEAYEGLDFDRSLLRAAYEAAPDALRRRVAARARQAGRVEWVEVVTGPRLVRLAEMSAAEWQAALDVLASQARWGELWRLAQEAPPTWAARLLQRLPAEHAPAADGAGAAELLRLAAEWREPQLASLLRPRAAHDAPARIYALAVSPDGGLLATVHEAGGFPQLWRLPGGESLGPLSGEPAGTTQRLEPPDEEVPDVPPLKPPTPAAPAFRALAISPRGRLLIAGEGQASLFIAGEARARLWVWGLPEGACREVPKVNQGIVDCLAVSPRGLLLASGSGDGRVWLWDLHDVRPLRLLRRHAAGVTCLAWSPDGKLLASGGADGSLCLWTAPEGELLHVWRGGGPVRSVAFRPGGGLVAGLWELSGVRLCEVPSGNELPLPQGHAGVVECFAFAPDGGALATGGRDHTVRLWALSDCRPLGLLAGHTGPVTCLAVSPDGRVLASGGDDRTVELWGLPDGRPLRTLKGFPAPVYLLAASPNGQALVAAAGARVEVWATELVRLAGVPVARLTPAEVAWVNEALRDASLPADERQALEFIAALARRRKRFDIHLDDAAPRIAVGEFDIEIAG